MSNVQNDVWIETAHENFQQAVSEGNLLLAQEIIKDTIDAGFSDEANKMEETLRELPVGRIADDEDII